MVLGRWNLALLMVERRVNTVLLDWWRYSKYLYTRRFFLMGRHHLTEFMSNIYIPLCKIYRITPYRRGCPNSRVPSCLLVKMISRDVYLLEISLLITDFPYIVRLESVFNMEKYQLLAANMITNSLIRNFWCWNYILNHYRMDKMWKQNGMFEVYILALLLPTLNIWHALYLSHPR